jgi:lysyl-tRNA synthetase, class II
MKPEQKQVALTDDEKAVFAILKNHSPIDLNALKAPSGLSNKKWDKTIKVLNKNKLVKVENMEDYFLVQII